ncbi:hypothetical protein [Alicyclobacillus sp. SO9]|uniref:hypothetical protein n=1 Tax=Alicyclobacillus sp. SO9 TaxID=2665646 RepID=UPI0018E8ED05|nr:hypothetical protein [Alicyclobacillus sp. SO9]QQE76770.1 hypothetical protein GI364_12130 [Alicyclobacillus sp. SO9]
MAKWKAWLITIAAIVVLSAGAIFMALYNNLNTEWKYQRQAAQIALNESPVLHITSHSVFTDTVQEEVFSGTDAFGTQWYAFVSGPPWKVHAVRTKSVLKQAQVKAIAAKAGVHPISMHLGYLNGQHHSAVTASSQVVWEIYGTSDTGKRLYLYLNGETGKQLWKYVLST